MKRAFEALLLTGLLAAAGCSQSSTPASAPATPAPTATGTATPPPATTTTAATPTTPAVPAPSATAAATPPAAAPAPNASAAAAPGAQADNTPPASSAVASSTPITLGADDAAKLKTAITALNTASTALPGTLTVGATLPLEVVVHPIPAAANVAATGSAKYAIVNNTIVLADPVSYKVLYVFN